MSDKQPKPAYDRETFKQAGAPLVEWLNQNANPHAMVIVQQGLAILHTAEVGATFPVPD